MSSEIVMKWDYLNAIEVFMGSKFMPDDIRWDSWVHE